MKKLLSLVLVLMLYLAAAAIAESDAETYVPSKTTGDMTVIVASAANMPAGASFDLGTVKDEDLTEEEKTVVATELEKLQKAGSVEKYFGDVVDANGKPVDLKELVGTDELNVFEFSVLSCEGYETEWGTVNMVMQFSTPYQKGDTVAVLVGFVSEENGEQTVAWTAYEGEVIDNSGRIQTELDAETVDAIQNGTALLAIVSK